MVNNDAGAAGDGAGVATFGRGDGERETWTGVWEGCFRKNQMPQAIKIITARVETPKMIIFFMSNSGSVFSSNISGARPAGKRGGAGFGGAIGEAAGVGVGIGAGLGIGGGATGTVKGEG